MPVGAEAGSITIPAWSFTQGNVRIDADPGGLADAGPVVVGADEKPWGWSLEYELDVPVAGEYTMQICYASTESRPVEVYFDGRTMVSRSCTDVTFKPGASGGSTPTAASSAAKWQSVHRYGGHPAKLKITEGKHTLRITRAGPLPSLVAIRLDTAAEFPEGWKQPKYKVRDIEAVPTKFRSALAKTVVLPPPVSDAPTRAGAASLLIPSWTFDRGNAKVHASPDQYADGTPLVGGGPEGEPSEEASVEFDIEFPADADYTLQFRYASAEARPVDVWIDGKHMAKGCTGATIDSRPMEYPVTFSSTARVLKWEGVFDYKTGKLLNLPITKGKHTVKISRRGPLPNMAALRFDSATAFPEGWQQPERKGDITRVEPRLRALFLPPGAVNTAALRVAINDTIKTLGTQYPDGEKYLKELDQLEVDSGTTEDQLAALRSRALLNHPALNFDKLLFLKRPSRGYGHTYSDQQQPGSGGNLCILSPVSPDGKVTNLVPELDGGLFDRFDLSFDAKKVVFGYRKEGGTFRIYEIDIDPVAGKMVPGSLRQLTAGSEAESEYIACNNLSGRCRVGAYNDMDPCYLPDGRIIFTSTRSMRGVFCAGSTVTTLYVMDADGSNIRCLSAGPINELSPSVMDDGRILYTRWEYVDKGLGNGAGLWTIRQDGSGSDHVYKNNTVWPAGMANARGIPGSQKVVTIGGGHHTTAVGTVILVDARRTRRTIEPMTCITPETGFPPSMGAPTTKYGIFMDPFPFSEKFFLVAHDARQKRNAEPGFGIYALDAWGNRAELYRDPEIDCYEPIPLLPRRVPVEIASLAAKRRAASVGLGVGPYSKKGIATLFIQDVYRGLTGIERGRVKYLRVMGALESPWNEFGMSKVGPDVHRKRVYGVVKVHEDGSAYFKVPAEENLFFQTLDENYMSLQHMASFINMMPGEQRACIGCHEHRRTAPNMEHKRSLAMDNPPQDIMPQPGDTGPRAVHFAVDVQPTLDRHCVGCHSGDNAKGNLDLAGIPTHRYSQSYENLMNSDLISYRECAYGSAHFRAVPPLTHGSHLSKIVSQVQKAPCKSNLTREEFIRLVTWIDANIPFYGTYRGKNSLQDKDHPDFRSPPLVVK